MNDPMHTAKEAFEAAPAGDGRDVQPSAVQPTARRISCQLDRIPYRWTGVDRDGNEKSGQTLMRDRTLPKMIEGFHVSGYRQLDVYRGAGPEAVHLGGISPAVGFSPPKVGYCRPDAWPAAERICHAQREAT
jgi:hypothetical protein